MGRKVSNSSTGVCNKQDSASPTNSMVRKTKEIHQESSTKAHEKQNTVFTTEQKQKTGSKQRTEKLKPLKHIHEIISHTSYLVAAEGKLHP